MMRTLGQLRKDDAGSSATEMALVVPFFLALLFGSVELGNFFMTEHALQKQVQDGARFGSRLEIASGYSCPTTVFKDAGWATQITNVTKNGVVTGAGNPRFGSWFWARNCTGKAQTVTASVRCVDKDQVDSGDTGFTGIYTSLPGTTIPVVKVEADVKYPSVLSGLGFNSVNLCLTATSEAAVQGL